MGELYLAPLPFKPELTNVHYKTTLLSLESRVV